jgi:hypothetical protein
LALGSHKGSAQDPLLIRWPSQETLTTWSPLATNTAGDKLLDSGNDIIGSTSTRFGELVLTDLSAHLASYVGAPFIFSVKKVGENCGLIAPHGATAYNGQGYWMSRGRFFSFDGTVREIPCDLQDEVFDSLNLAHAFKIVAATVVKKHEVWWFYPANASRQNNRAIIYNVAGQIWYSSDMPRSAWLDENVFTAKPVAVDNAGKIMLQETGVDANGEALPYFLQSGDMEIAQGDQMMHVRRLINDFKRLSGNHELTLIAKGYPNENGIVKGPYSFGEGAKQVSARARGRSIAMKIASNSLGADFRLGVWRADVTPHGRRP